jgi:hypothetical protein
MTDVRRLAEVHMIHHADDIRECSATHGGPNYVEQDGQDGQCRYAPHWSRCHCADAVAQAVKERDAEWTQVSVREHDMLRAKDEEIERLKEERAEAISQGYSTGYDVGREEVARLRAALQAHHEDWCLQGHGPCWVDEALRA